MASFGSDRTMLSNLNCWLKFAVMSRFRFPLATRWKEDPADWWGFAVVEQPKHILVGEREKVVFHEFSGNFIALKKYMHLSLENVCTRINYSTNQRPIFCCFIDHNFHSRQMPGPKIGNWCTVWTPPRTVAHRSLRSCTNFNLECKLFNQFLLGNFKLFNQF